MIHIDGSLFEGGGQILRIALALSTLTGNPFQAHRIRHNRPRPGLKNQHLACFNALAALSGAEASGARPGSDAVSFRPGKITAGSLRLDIGTAGSIPLLLQSLLVPCLFAETGVSMRIVGGTDTKWSIPVDYFVRLILPFFNEFAEVRARVLRRGFFPKGAGCVEIRISPRYRLKSHTRFDDFISGLRKRHGGIFLTQRPSGVSIRGISSASERLKGADVAARQARGAASVLEGRWDVSIEREYTRTASAGTVITLWAEDSKGRTSLGADALGERGVRAERVGASAAAGLVSAIDSGAAADVHLADNLLPLLALVGGRIRTAAITGHILSGIHVCEKFLDTDFEVDDREHIITASVHRKP